MSYVKFCLTLLLTTGILLYLTIFIVYMSDYWAILAGFLFYFNVPNNSLFPIFINLSAFSHLFKIIKCRNKTVIYKMFIYDVGNIPT